MKSLPREEYDQMIAACDVGLIFLDHRFTIPNFPSRLLYYMQAGLPVLACTDPYTDVGKVITDSGFGWWCESNDVTAFSKLILKCESLQFKGYKIQAYKCLKINYTSDLAYKIIMKE